MKLLASLFLCLSASAADLLLILQRDLPISAAPHIDAWQSQVEREGYTVTRMYGPKANLKETNQALNFARSQVWPWVREHSGGYVFLIGDLPMARTGLSVAPDGHPGTTGAYVSSMFYGCPDGGWTDEGDNVGYLPKPLHLNLAGDGRFDQQAGPRHVAPDSTGPLCAKVGIFNPWFNPKTFGVTNMVSVEYVTDSIRRYVELNIKWRTGQLSAQRVALGVDKGLPAPGMITWAASQVGASNVVTFTRATNAVPPFLWDNDFKGFTESATLWGKLATGNLFSVLDLTWGSYQIDYGTLRTTLPLNCGVLALGNMGRMWNLEGWRTKTVGELWEQTVTGQLGTTHVILYGDPTIRLSPPR